MGDASSGARSSTRRKSVKVARDKAGFFGSAGTGLHGRDSVPARGAWDTMYKALCLFKQQHHHICASRKVGDASTRRLGEWVHRQRVWYRALRAGRTAELPAHIAADRIAKLGALGFVWDVAAVQTGGRAVLGGVCARKRKVALGSPV